MKGSIRLLVFSYKLLFFHIDLIRPILPNKSGQALVSYFVLVTGQNNGKAITKSITGTLTFGLDIDIAWSGQEQSHDRSTCQQLVIRGPAGRENVCGLVALVFFPTCLVAELMESIHVWSVYYNCISFNHMMYCCSKLCPSTLLGSPKIFALTRVSIISGRPALEFVDCRGFWS